MKDLLTPMIDQKTIGNLLLVLDLAGTFVFAISGAMLGMRRKLDLFGVLFLSFAAASAGGITRDLLIGAVGYVHRGLQESPAKLALVTHLRHRSGLRLDQSSLMRAEKFNLFVWRPQT